MLTLFSFRILKGHDGQNICLRRFSVLSSPPKCCVAVAILRRRLDRDDELVDGLLKNGRLGVGHSIETE